MTRTEVRLILSMAVLVNNLGMSPEKAGVAAQNARETPNGGYSYEAVEGITIYWKNPPVKEMF